MALESFDIQSFDINTHLYIEASAGTGKTYTINQIVKKIIAEAESDGKPVTLDQILIVTYTEKATGELRDRIRKTMQQAEIEEQDADKKKRFSAARELADNAAIFTIHSFCQRTLEEFAFAARSASKLDIVDDDAAGDFIDGTIRDELSFDPDFVALYDENDDLPKKIRTQMMQGIKNYYQNACGEEDARIVLLDKTDTKANNKNVRLYRYLEALLPKLYARWQAQKAEKKVQSYDDMLRSVRESVLQSGSKLKKQLQEKYRFAIIDEFQDTNQKQWDIFRSVFMDSAEKPGEHTLIVVGDPKQSIYAFQGANVAVYRAATKTIGYGKSLATNWRSSADMIHACNELFSHDFFSEPGDFTPSDAPAQKAANGSLRAQEPLIYEQGAWKKLSPFQIALQTDAERFAQTCANEMVHYCMPLACGTPAPALIAEGQQTLTRLLVWDKELRPACGGPKGAYRAVQFNDFAVLARARSEMPPIERAMKKLGIPFRRYKDASLFAGRECQHWIALFKAIAAPDFTGRNRSLLTEALYSWFFRADKTEPAESLLRRIESARYDTPACRERSLLLAWKRLADEKKWAALLEHIYADSHVEALFSTPTELDSLARLRQIGDYAVDYAYTHRCTLDELVDHLSRLANKSESSEGDENLVAKNTDFNCVQVMTIHASKGLEFPVVIAAGGFKPNVGKSKMGLPCLYHEAESKQARLSFDAKSKELRIAEDIEEWKRLFYVAYTRAGSLQLLPQYDEWNKEDKDGNPPACFSFLQKSFAAFMNAQAQKGGEALFAPLPDLDHNESHRYAPEQVSAILAANSVSEAAEEAETDEARDERLSQARKAVFATRLMQHSYTSLSQSAQKAARQLESAQSSAAAAAGDDSERFDTDGQLFVTEASLQREDLSAFDRDALVIPAQYDPILPSSDSALFPKGKHFGIALHEVFEKADFVRIGALSNAEDAAADKHVQYLVRTSFAKEAIPMQDDEQQPTEAARAVARMVWHTLSARLPEIQGGKATGRSFSLGSLGEAERRAEVSFALSVDNPLRNFCKGFVDLIFVRNIAGENVYSVLDWKSDIMPEEAYKDGGALAQKVSAEYAIQRVLYSYSLVVWLGQFYPEATLEEIFEKHFGGIYYVLARGCQAQSGNGIYAQTWKDWRTLKSAFDHLCAQKMKTIRK